MKLFILLGALIFGTISCFKTEIESPDLSHTNLSLVWKQYRNDDRITGCIIPKINNKGVIYSQDFLLGQDESSLLYFNKSNGELLWRWADYYNIRRYEAPQYFSKMYLDNDYFTLANGGHVYSINILNGTTNWRSQTGLASFSDINGYSDHIYFTGADSFGVQYLLKTHKSLPSWDTIYYGPSIVENVQESLDFITAFQKNENSYLILNSSYYNYSTYESHDFLIKFDLDRKQAIDTLLVQNKNGSLSDFPILNNNLMYNRFGNTIICVDLASFDLKWQTSFDTPTSCDISESGQYILINQENRYLYCLNKSDGSIVWKSPSSGTVDNIVVYKDKAYLVGGGDGLLHCYDVNTGEELYTLESPDYQKNGNAFFVNYLTIDESTGRLYLASYQSAICYQIED